MDILNKVWDEIKKANNLPDDTPETKAAEKFFMAGAAQLHTLMVGIHQHDWCCEAHQLAFIVMIESELAMLKTAFAQKKDPVDMFEDFAKNLEPEDIATKLKGKFAPPTGSVH